MATINITNILNHKAVYRYDPQHIGEPYRDWCDHNPPYLVSTDNTTGIQTLYTDERHRGVWCTMVHLGYDSRKADYVLAPATFEDANMMIIDDFELRFLQLYAYEVNALPDAEREFVDFTSIADKVQDMFFDAGRLMSTDVQVFYEILKFGHPTDRDTKLFILGNYAIMKTPMRTHFLKWLSDHLKDREIFGHHAIYKLSMTNACRRYSSRWHWRGAVCRNPTSEICKAFQFRVYPPNDPLSLIQFVRNGLRHLSASGVYHPGDAWYIMNGYFENFFSTIQEQLFQDGALTETQLLLFQPPPPY